MRPIGRFVIGTQEPKNFCSASRGCSKATGQKLLNHGASTVPHGREAEQKFFGSFFQKRTSSFLCNAQMTWIGDLHEV
jgi:hypothetical protein